MKGIYKIECTANNKIYIGQTVNFSKRKCLHLNHLIKGSHPNPHLQNAFFKYGKSNLVFTFIEECEDKDLDDKEMFYISLYDSFNSGFNLTLGGKSTLGWKPTEAQKENISAALKKFYEENPHKKEEISKRTKERMNRPEYKEAVSKVHKGKNISLHHRDKLSKAFKGRKMLPQVREALLKSKLGIPRSEESKLKQSMTHYRKRAIEIDGIQYISIAEASRQLNIKADTIRKRGYSDSFPNYCFICA